MSGPPTRSDLRFLHASDLHLEQPLHGVGSVSDHLTDIFLDAPFLAAERMFNLAIQEAVDFVALAGDVINPRPAGPRGLDFLLRQFRRLHEANIGVYWSRGAVDHFEHWPTAVPLPPNVIMFGDEHVDAVTHRRGKRSLAVIQGRAATENRRFRADEFDSDSSLPTIVVIYGKERTESLERSDITYWALGGRHSPTSICSGASTAHYCGSPQGRRPSEEGAHGCNLVEIDGRGRLTRTNMSTDVVRWCNVAFELPAEVDRAGLMRLLSDRTHQLLETAGQHQLLIRWKLTDSDELTDTRSDLLAARLREGGLADEVLDSLRTEFGSTSPGAWHLEIDVEPPTILPSGWYEEDTVLGDLLRAVQRAQEDASHLLGSGLPADARVNEEVAAALEMTSPEERQLILRRVAALGVDLLRGDRVLSEELGMATLKKM